jgi:hypothetical protein
MYGEVMQVNPQKKKDDCGAASLSMALGVPYEMAFQAIRHVNPNAIGGAGKRYGTKIVDLQRAAVHLGSRLVRRPKFNTEEDEGILSIRSVNPQVKWWHYAVLYRGLIFDTDSRVWRVESYVQQKNAKLCSLLRVICRCCGGHGGHPQLHRCDCSAIHGCLECDRCLNCCEHCGLQGKMAA